MHPVSGAERLWDHVRETSKGLSLDVDPICARFQRVAPSLKCSVAAVSGLRVWMLCLSSSAYRDLLSNCGISPL